MKDSGTDLWQLPVRELAQVALGRGTGANYSPAEVETTRTILGPRSQLAAAESAKAALWAAIGTWSLLLELLRPTDGIRGQGRMERIGAVKDAVIKAGQTSPSPWGRHGSSTSSVGGRELSATKPRTKQPEEG